MLIKVWTFHRNLLKGKGIRRLSPLLLEDLIKFLTVPLQNVLNKNSYQ